MHWPGSGQRALAPLFLPCNSSTHTWARTAANSHPNPETDTAQRAGRNEPRQITALTALLVLLDPSLPVTRHLITLPSLCSPPLPLAFSLSDSSSRGPISLSSSTHPLSVARTGATTSNTTWSGCNQLSLPQHFLCRPRAPLTAAQDGRVGQGRQVLPARQGR